MSPLRFAGPVVDRAERRADAAHRARGVAGAAEGRTVHIPLVVNLVALRRVQINQSRVRVEGRWRPVLAAAVIRRNEGATKRCFLLRIGNRLSLVIESFEPVGRFDVRNGEQVLPGDAIEHEEDAVAAGLCEQFPRLPVERSVEQYGNLRRIPIVRVVRRGLEVPRHPPGVRVEGDDRRRVEVGTLACVAPVHRIGIARGHINQVQLGVIRDRRPRHAAAVLHGVRIGPGVGAGFARTWCRVPLPLNLAGVGIS